MAAGWPVDNYWTGEVNDNGNNARNVNLDNGNAGDDNVDNGNRVVCRP